MNYNYIKDNIYKIPKSETEWNITFFSLLKACNILLKDDDGEYKNMDEI